MKHLISLLVTLFLCMPCGAQNWGAYVKKRPKTSVQKSQTKKNSQRISREVQSKKSQTSTRIRKTAKTSNNKPKYPSFPSTAIIINGVTFEMIKVEAGSFSMGATPEQENPDFNEKPAHNVTITNDYYIGKTEVTQKLWKAVMGGNPSYYEGDNRPVEMISWYDCLTFIEKLNAATGKKFRLPTEAEWEFAARGGNSSKHYQYSGSDDIDEVAWYGDNSNEGTHNVATKQPNELGLYDMSGNVWEWCHDWEINYCCYSQTNPTGGYGGSYPVNRGGSLNDEAWNCRSSRRDSDFPYKTYSDVGFRLALSEEPTYHNNQKGLITLNATVNRNTLIANGISYEMVNVEAGIFTMGATPEQQDPDDDEKPSHQVTISKDFYIGKTEVTQVLWESVMGYNPSHFKGDNRPVENVTWEDCQTFIEKLNAATDKKFRLPTEAEWEFAARGGNNSQHYQYSGHNNLDAVAWYSDNTGNGTQNVAMRLPNELGLYDMSGNVLEWCEDWNGSYSSSPQTDPTGSNNGWGHVFRGGCWYDDARYCRSSYRGCRNPNYGDGCLGFRLVLVQDNPRRKPNIQVIDNTSGHTLIADNVSYEMVRVPQGSYTIGKRYRVSNGYWNIWKGGNEVETTKDFCIGKTEVTQALWETVMGDNPSHFKGDNKPVENVSWDDCQIFIAKLNAATGKKFRLPTETEWEIAARGGKHSKYYEYSGSNSIDDVAWYGGNSGRETHDVATKKPNKLELYDMSGNVWEWCQDLYTKDGFSQRNLLRPQGGELRICRGGDWGRDAGSCSSSNRGGSDAGVGNNCIGLRLVLSE